ncbi:MAG: 1-deoxy-D-xylulose-5-phosphate synthase [Aestuariivirga sp.]|uniref:1-deoxy-D-xylulose-5-phosphate synthase n=1 Tax=Aestuariivirga sp. TaxID=2650926 RepID=UPI0025BE6B32|nr:1-deoxy-D-xylulose-5-phosphate synthase [Aestuariivirga sp.]MCA3559999.1 1-deoxy-D-xylulose-5-phosphate synthase [Aestuariivirga sp.]
MDKLTPLLDRAPTPEAIRLLSPKDLPRLANELRAEVISAAAETGGHFGGGLGVVELTVALHYVFDTPRDKLIWDVSHQAYPHKILTGRRERIRSIRQRGGLYGFTKREESEYDPFGAAHSSTSISAALGMALARDLTGGGNHVIAVIGDGAITGGMAWEAMNHAGSLPSRLIVILNDNGMSIAPAVGALNGHLAALRRGKLPSVFEGLGFRHEGPVDGHDMKALLASLRRARDTEESGPILIHVVTEKGRGHPFKAPDKEKYHAVGKFDPVTFAFKTAKANAPTFTQVFAASLIAAAERDPKLVAITAAMPSGTGLDIFAERFPNRTVDVGIAEQHAVTLAAGLASEGMTPVCAIYSTFLQRGFDQVVHDVALQRLPVRFAIDRAGLVGQDGATHAGSFDLAYMAMLPGMVVMAPADASELRRMVATAVAYDEGPIAFRYPRGEAAGTDDALERRPLAIGRGRLLREGTDVAILSLGARLEAALAAAQELAALGIAASVADARFCKPLDTELVEGLARHHPLLVTVEDGAIGGFSSHVLQHLAAKDLLGRTRLRAVTLPDRFVAHGAPAEQYADAGLDSRAIAAGIRAALAT